MSEGGGHTRQRLTADRLGVARWWSVAFTTLPYLLTPMIPIEHSLYSCWCELSMLKGQHEEKGRLSDSIRAHETFYRSKKFSPTAKIIEKW